MATFLPELPSDNVYKFFAFSGLFLVVYFMTYYIISQQDLNVQRAEYNYKLQKRIIIKSIYLDSLKRAKTKSEEVEEAENLSMDLRDETDSLQYELYKIGHKQGKHTLISERAKDPVYREQQIFLLQYYPHLADGYRTRILNNRLKEAAEVVSKLEKERLYDAEIEHLTALRKLKDDDIEFLFYTTNVAIVVGLLLFAYGMLSWYHRIQIPSDKILLRDSLRT